MVTRTQPVEVLAVVERAGIFLGDRSEGGTPDRKAGGDSRDRDRACLRKSPTPFARPSPPVPLSTGTRLISTLIFAEPGGQDAGRGDVVGPGRRVFGLVS